MTEHFKTTEFVSIKSDWQPTTTAEKIAESLLNNKMDATIDWDGARQFAREEYGIEFDVEAVKRSTWLLDRNEQWNVKTVIKALHAQKQ